MNRELTQKIAKTARLELTEAELEKFTKDLQEILQAFKVLDEVDTNNTRSSFRPIEQKNILREDKPTSCFSQKEALRFTKNKRDGFFIGPKTIE